MIKLNLIHPEAQRLAIFVISRNQERRSLAEIRSTRDYLRPHCAGAERDGIDARIGTRLSHQAQLYRIIRMFVDVPPGVVPFARSSGNPIQPTEVVAKLRAAALDLQRPHNGGPQSSED